MPTCFQSPQSTVKMSIVSALTNSSYYIQLKDNCSLLFLNYSICVYLLWSQTESVPGKGPLIFMMPGISDDFSRRASGRGMHQSGLFVVATNNPKISANSWNGILFLGHIMSMAGAEVLLRVIFRNKYRVRNSHYSVILSVSWQRRKKKIVKTYHFHTLLVKTSYTAISEFIRIQMFTFPIWKSQSKCYSQSEFSRQRGIILPQGEVTTLLKNNAIYHRQNIQKGNQIFQHNFLSLIVLHGWIYLIYHFHIFFF